MNIPTEITIRPEIEAESVTFIKEDPDKTLAVSLSQTVDPTQIGATLPGSSITQSLSVAAASTIGAPSGLEGGDKDRVFEPEGSEILDEQEKNGGEKFASFEELNSHRITESGLFNYLVSLKSVFIVIVVVNCIVYNIGTGP